MNSSIIEDENLPFELLDEQIIRPRRLNSLHPENKISCTPFQKTKDCLRKTISCAIQDNDKNIIDKGSDKLKIKSMQAGTYLLQGKEESKSLKSDIRILLRKAMELRNLYSMDLDQENEPGSTALAHQRMSEETPRELTMADVEKPS